MEIGDLASFARLFCIKIESKYTKKKRKLTGLQITCLTPDPGPDLPVLADGVLFTGFFAAGVGFAAGFLAGVPDTYIKGT